MTTRMICLLGLLVACGRAEDAPRVRQVPGGLAERADDAFQLYGCGGCHVIPGIAGANGRVAPPLQEFAERAYVAGVLPNEPEALVHWIMEPDQVNPATAMPDLGVTEQDARDMAAYLYTLGRRRRVGAR